MIYARSSGQARIALMARACYDTVPVAWGVPWHLEVTWACCACHVNGCALRAGGQHDTVSERLRRWTRNPLGSARRGSNPLGVACCPNSATLPVHHLGCEWREADALLAQWLERAAVNRKVTGSIPVGSVLATRMFSMFTVPRENSATGN